MKINFFRRITHILLELDEKCTYNSDIVSLSTEIVYNQINEGLNLCIKKFIVQIKVYNILTDVGIY